MKRILGIFVVVLVCASAHGQAPIRRNALTTNALAGVSVTGATNIGVAGGLTMETLHVTNFTGIGVAPIAGQRLTVQASALGTTPTNGIFLTNGTAAAVGAQQVSPEFEWAGNVWATTAGTSSPVRFRSYVLPVQSGVGTATWTLDSSINNAAFASPLTYTSAGTLTSPANIIAGSSSGLGFSTKGFLVSSANGAFELKNSTLATIGTLQANQPQVTKTANYTIVALDSGLRFVNIGAAATNRLDLPTAAAGMHFHFYVDAAFNCRIQATGSDVIRDGVAVSGAANGIESAVVGSTLHLFSPKATLWVIDTKSGTWSALVP